MCIYYQNESAFPLLGVHLHTYKFRLSCHCGIFIVSFNNILILLSRNNHFLLNLDKQIYYIYFFYWFWVLFNTLFSFCELSYACAKCFSSGPLVFPGPIFMNHREQALARIRPHPAQLKPKRDKHKGIWSSLLARVEKADTPTLPLPCTQSLFSKKCKIWLLPFFLLVFCYLRRKRTHLYVDFF